ncbi:catechol 2,3-dioxygenase-like lactoylglutathione lyase family enzyme [Streptosporangium becharense]|uniref:Catechol 2,3-dioxygenase-like lactoylglutathione lyase family enzyme n=1 Tax=Streptosporangium becharense TaxID=1816182 RepID=A0A7W9IMC8_9ACTN|nr:VOC family protein [Streptosporangium becharense]MBB2911498.1 catechol 2,3-dioxygenase-like lactoylglutathione lyase family enzyme [Streptosporangium becharense]MBB5822684.1 catechol 2,3-dioxygenase-like lactoylglutathione lyase family enzyme [Streptosporangium becharense]
MKAALTGVHHVKIWVSDLARSRSWYERVLGLEHRISFEDDDGVIRGMSFGVPGAGFQIALRENPGLARALSDADPFGLEATREGLDAWAARLDELGVPHSPIVRASSGYAMGFRDPDGVQIRLYAADERVHAALDGEAETERVYRPGPLPTVESD